jgi:aspartate kinase
MEKIFKFGGGVLVNPESVQKAIALTKEYGAKFVVISAFGKSTNALEKVYMGLKQEKPARANKGIEEYLSINAPFFEKGVKHSFLMRQKDLLESIIERKKRFTSDKFLKDAILCLGEKAAVFAFHNFLRKEKEMQGQIFFDLIKTISSGLVTEVDKEKIKAFVKGNHSFLTKKVVSIIPGFIGVDQNGLDVTLGREGSDYTAGIIANVLRSLEIPVHSVTLWKNVPGLMDNFGGDFETLIPEVSYESFKRAINFKGSASGLVHINTMAELEEFQIPLILKNFNKPEEKGTMVY